MHVNFSEELIEEVRIANDILEVVGEYVKLEKKGKDYFGLCPFHREKTPSFSVSPTKQMFYCFGCGRGGSVIQFIMDAENIDFIESLKLLADRARIELPEEGSGKEAAKARLRQAIMEMNKEAARFFYKMLESKEGEEARVYFKNRGINDRTIIKFGLGYSCGEWDRLFRYLLEKGYDKSQIEKSGLILRNKRGGYYDRFRKRIMFPIFDLRGNVIGFGGRVLDSSTPKYLNSPETLVFNKRRNLYGLNFAKNSDAKELIIVEGYMDVISLQQSGITNAVATLGTALTESQGRLLMKYSEEVIISYDTDKAGQAATTRGLDLLSSIGCNVKVLIIPDGKDPDEYIRNNGVNEYQKLIKSSMPLVEYKIKCLKKHHNTDTTEDKVKFLNKAADVLAKIDNSVEREMYIKKIAGEYRITEDSLFSEVYRRIKRKASYKTAARSFNSPVNSIVRNVEGSEEDRLTHDERFILALLCVDNSLYRLIKDELSLEIFSEKKNREIAQIVFERLGNNRGIVPGELLSILDKDTANDFSRIFKKECHCDDNKKAIMGKIRNIELLRIEKRQKEILEQLKDEESLAEGDVERLKLELRDLTVLIKRQKSG
ncbi:MAG: DNA primase [Acetivibrionales bacterium]|jgi:DNA primase